MKCTKLSPFVYHILCWREAVFPSLIMIWNEYKESSTVASCLSSVVWSFYLPCLKVKIMIVSYLVFEY